MSYTLDCQLVRNAPGWPKNLETLARNSLDAALAVISEELAGNAEIAVLLTGDREQRELNARWREIDKSTNVLSFPALGPGAPLAGPLGEISLARETLEREAALANRPFEHHFAHLLIHGFLHIVGYDHLGDVDAERMEALETEALARLGIPDPHTEAGAVSAPVNQ